MCESDEESNNKKCNAELRMLNKTKEDHRGISSV